MVFTKGKEWKGNPDGRPKGSKNKINKHIFEEFLRTIKDVEKDERISQGKTFFKHILTRAYKNDSVAISILKKLIPDQTFNIEEFQSENPIKVQFETVSTVWSMKEKMIKQNREGLLEILKKVQSKELGIEEGLDKLGAELLKKEKDKESEEQELVEEVGETNNG